MHSDNNNTSSNINSLNDLYNYLVYRDNDYLETLQDIHLNEIFPSDFTNNKNAYVVDKIICYIIDNLPINLLKYIGTYHFDKLNVEMLYDRNDLEQSKFVYLLDLFTQNGEYSDLLYNMYLLSIDTSKCLGDSPMKIILNHRCFPWYYHAPYDIFRDYISANHGTNYFSSRFIETSIAQGNTLFKILKKKQDELDDISSTCSDL
jgi:hypothetical protein